jgi:predicted  nucleic acid-binding Zn-ribbon protein
VSDSERPEKAAFRELEQLVRHLGDELSSFRRRALQAEARLKAIEATGTGGVVPVERLAALEQENAELKRRLEAARQQVGQILQRVRFVREQQTAEAK